MPRMLRFEGQDMAAPQESEQMLTQLYGDYMQLPPLPQRCCHADLEKTIVG